MGHGPRCPLILHPFWMILGRHVKEGQPQLRTFWLHLYFIIYYKKCMYKLIIIYTGGVQGRARGKISNTLDRRRVGGFGNSKMPCPICFPATSGIIIITSKHNAPRQNNSAYLPTAISRYVGGVKANCFLGGSYPPKEGTVGAEGAAKRNTFQYSLPASWLFVVFMQGANPDVLW